jgi:hypothetical protein
VWVYFLDNERNLRPAYHYIKGDTDLVGQNPYGQVSGGRITVSTRATYFPWEGEYDLTWVENCLRLVNMVNSDYIAHCQMDRKIDDGEMAEGLSLPNGSPGMVLVLISTTDPPESEHQPSETTGNRNAWGLIPVQLLPESLDRYKRIGVFTSRVKTGGGTRVFDGSSVETFVIA